MTIGAYYEWRLRKRLYGPRHRIPVPKPPRIPVPKRPRIPVPLP